MAAADGTHIVMGYDDNNSANESGNMLLPPPKRKEMGRPTTSREKASYEGLTKRTRQQGHKQTICADCGDLESRQEARIVAQKATPGTTVTTQQS